MKIIFFTFSLFMTAFNCFGQNVENLTLHFGFNKFKIEKKYKLIIDSAVDGKAFQEINIEAHCDAVGSMDYNDSLSLKRAMGVKNYLISKNINENNIKVSAFGKRVPIAKNAAMNRRAEIRFVFKPLDSIRKIETIEKVAVDSLGINNLEVGATIRLDNINFIGGEHYFVEGSIRSLVRLLTTLELYPNLEIEIQGYICCTSDGTDGYDNSTGTPNLSVNRAKAVYDFLVKKGIDAQRLTYKGFGSSKKLVEEITENDRITNRRVEIKILKK
jgi:outer membrane protein OmpA-like peptidoglycan-associated protein